MSQVATSNIPLQHHHSARKIRLIHKVVRRSLLSAQENALKVSQTELPHYLQYADATLVQLHHHHSHEDDIFFPAFIEKMPKLGEFASQHPRIHEMMEESQKYVKECIQDFNKFNGEKMAATFKALRDVVIVHLNAEEEYVTTENVFAAYPDPKYLAEVDGRIAARAQKDGSPPTVYLAHLLTHLSQEESDQLLDKVPWLVRRTIFKIFMRVNARTLWVYSRNSD